MDFNFKGKNIIVTGAGQGIGRGVCEQLHKLGANVFAFSRSVAPLEELKKEFPTINTIAVDIGNWSETVNAFKVIKGVPIHGLVNNAGVAVCKPFLEMTEKDIDDVFNVNFKALFNVSQLVVPQLVTGASIVNVSSLASHIAIDGHSVYSATKAAVDSLTKSLALELGSRKIRVNSVNPTVVLTQMGRANWSDPAKSGPLLNAIPLHRFAELHEVIEPIVFLLSDRSSFVNGHALPIDGGYLAC